MVWLSGSVRFGENGGVRLFWFNVNYPFFFFFDLRPRAALPVLPARPSPVRCLGEKCDLFLAKIADLMSLT